MLLEIVYDRFREFFVNAAAELWVAGNQDWVLASGCDEDDALQQHASLPRRIAIHVAKRFAELAHKVVLNIALIAKEAEDAHVIAFLRTVGVFDGGALEGFLVSVVRS